MKKIDFKFIIQEQEKKFKIKIKKNNKNLFKSIYKEISVFFKKVYWKNFFSIKYLFLTTKYFMKYKKDINRNTISILLPSRQRFFKFQRFINSLIIKTLHNSRIEILVFLDEDDPEKNFYIKEINEIYIKKIKIRLFISKLETHPKRVNYLAKHSSGDLLLAMNDDVVIVTQDWDNILDLEYAKVNSSKPCALWINSGNKYPYLHCHQPIVNRAWYKKLGYIYSELFNFWYGDTWICDLSKRINTCLLLKKICFKEFNAQAFPEEADLTYLKNISNNNMEKDIDIWNTSFLRRLEESKKLLS
jgi:hypothetical protein